ncbi:Bax protein [Pseudoalteromonas phenolica O-BC30]|nr:Bax protein [Pseudoalteromonas phenolica O-BC30]
MRCFIGEKMLRNLLKLVIAVVAIYGLIYPFIQPEEVTEEVVEAPVQEQQPVKKVEVEKPLHDVKLPDFANIKDVRAKKKAFFDFIKPHVVKENQAILQQRASIEIALMMLQFEEELTPTQVKKLDDIFAYYRLGDADYTVESLQSALIHVDIIPKELALMQAANESAWGTSRFARIGLNFFGQWCYKKGCGLVPKRRADEAAHEVAAFKSVRASVKSYFRNLNTHNAYTELRAKRAQLRAEKKPIDATELTAGLLSYSERGDAYIEELNDMIRHNKAYFNEE